MNMLNQSSLADTLDSIAAGRTYSESALKQARDHEAARYIHRAAIRNYLNGCPGSTDHIRLQELAILIRGE